jgi:uncharacterized membrane protein
MRVLVGLVTVALLVGAAVAGVVLLRQDPPASTPQTCEPLTRAELPPRGSARLGDRNGLFVPRSGATRVGEVARARYVGDPGAGQLVVAFRTEDCTYTVTFPAGTRLREVRAWIRAR